MATYAIGDVQGCFDSLAALLAKIRYRRRNDTLWFAGDLINRGPKSLKVLRWLVDQDPSDVVAILGNHDLNLLATARGARQPSRRDTLFEVLRAPDRDDLLDWLQTRELVHYEDGWLMVHGGLHPKWSAAQAKQEAHLIERALDQDQWIDIWKRSRRNPPSWSPRLRGVERRAASLAFLVGARTLYRNRLVPDFSGAPEDAPRGCRPWFDARGPRRDAKVLFAHWASLGLHVSKGYVGLDTACVWGGRLTAYRLEDGAVFSVKSQE